MSADRGAGLDAHLVLRRGGFTLDAAVAVQPGATVALLGRNGAGKSTAVAALAGLAALDGGRITLDGTTLDDPDAGVFVPAERRAVGAVLQQTALFPHLSVADNVAFGLRAGGMRAADARRRAREALDDAGLGELADRRPTQVSGGQAARIALVRTLVRRPALVLLDEPLAAVDAEVRPELRAAIRAALDGFAGSALLVSHDPADAQALAGDVVVLDAGRVRQRGSLAAVRATPVDATVARLVGA